MKKILTLILTLCLLLCLSPAALAVVDQSESFYVADYANVLSDATEQTVIERNALLEQYCHEAQIVVVTVDYLDGMYSDEYAYQLFNDWGVGSAEESNGMLLLLAVQENKAWLAYGYGLSSAMGDRVDGLLDSYFWHDFDRGDYDAAVTKLLEGLTDFYEELYGVSLSGNARTWQSGTTRQTGRTGSGLGAIILLAIVFALLSGGSRNNGRGGRGLGSWLPWLLLFGSLRNRGPSGGYRGPDGGGFGGRGGFGGGRGGGGFGGGMGRGGGGFSGGGGGRR